MPSSTPAVDPTVQFIPIELDGKTYQMAFDLGSLADAEAAINKAGGDVNLLRALDFGNASLSGVQQLFACSLRKAQPDLSFTEAKKLVTLKTLYPIATALYEAWLESIGTNDKDDDEKKVVSPEPTPEPSPENSTGETSGPSLDTTSN